MGAVASEDDEKTAGGDDGEDGVVTDHDPALPVPSTLQVDTKLSDGADASNAKEALAESCAEGNSSEWWQGHAWHGEQASAAQDDAGNEWWQGHAWHGEQADAAQDDAGDSEEFGSTQENGSSWWGKTDWDACSRQAASGPTRDEDWHVNEESLADQNDDSGWDDCPT